MKSRSPFCFATILAIAAQLHSSPSMDSAVANACQAEAQAFAARTLFGSAISLETIQAMILLAAYSPRCWYLVGHAVRLAQRMRLGISLSDLSWELEDRGRQGTAKVPTATDISAGARRMRRVRVWMALAHLEQEIASGIGMRSLIDRDQRLQIRGLIEEALYPRADTHILAAVELLRHRGSFSATAISLCADRASDRFRDDVDEVSRRHGDVKTFFRDTIATLDACLAFWDHVLEGIDLQSRVIPLVKPLTPRRDRLSSNRAAAVVHCCAAHRCQS